MTIDAEILSALRSAGESAVSGADLAARLGISRAAIWARIEDLRRAGYEIHANPHEGYRLRGTPDRLHSDDLLALLGPGRLVGRDIRVFEETTSTIEAAEDFGGEFGAADWRARLDPQRRSNRPKFQGKIALLKIHIHADAEHDVIDLFNLGRHLGQNSANFAFADEDVVWPLDFRWQSGVNSNRACQGSSRGDSDLRRRLRGKRGAQ